MVYIPEDDRGTLCISSQAGCALDCAFCSTGKQGFNRNLTTAEIVGQLWHANRALLADGVTAPWVEQGRAPITNVVMMGMGEPLANYDHVRSALTVFLDDNAYGLSRRRVTLSTSGLVPAIDRLRDDCPVALAVSLHAGNDALRDRLVPINRKYPLRELLAACVRYLERAPRDFVTFEYVMLDGVNDRGARARARRARPRRPVQVQPDSVESVPGRRVPDEPARAHPRVPEGADRRRIRDDDPQDARRGHRRRVRPARRPRPGPHQAARADPSGARDARRALIPPARETTMTPLLRSCAVAVLAAAFAALLGACQSAPSAHRAAAARAAAAAVKPQEVSPKERAKLHAELGAGYYERGQMDVALEELNEAATLDPNNARIYNIYGLVYAMLGENAKAEQNFQRALALAPQDSEIRHNWGWYLCSNGRPRESIPEFELALSQSAVQDAGGRAGQRRTVQSRLRRHRGRRQLLPPRRRRPRANNAGAIYGLALMAYRQGRQDEARGWIKRLTQQPPAPPEALYLGMCIERKQGDRSAEQSYISQLRNRYPDSAEAKAIATGTCD